ncbi:hypothetical protein X275_08260 [Marinitoga sp. 1197]|uniref:hypothetical protein n=1 Tax=Marinitoga sp. 1197 TaxID=1428449 RepID=UPI000640EB39|nr:hypothetical protein [Marinitoga sp. 1197]KLO21874.1 hypothetical protein X275_08260 [Marinitoga sp. 1197]
MNTVKTLFLNDFEKYTNVINKDSKVLEFDVPGQKIYQIDSSRPFRMKLATKHEKTNYSISATEFNITVEGKIAIVDTDDLTKSVHAELIESNGTVHKLGIKAIDSIGKKITLTAATTGITGTLKVYYLFLDGYYKVAWEAPLGSSTEIKAFNKGSLGDLNSKKIFESSYYLPYIALLDDFMLQVYINAPVVVDFNNPLTFIEIPVIEFEKAEFEELAASMGYSIEMVLEHQRKL